MAESYSKDSDFKYETKPNDYWIKQNTYTTMKAMDEVVFLLKDVRSLLEDILAKMAQKSDSGF